MSFHLIKKLLNEIFQRHHKSVVEWKHSIKKNHLKLLQETKKKTHESLDVEANVHL